LKFGDGVGDVGGREVDRENKLVVIVHG
jgi:hypothetical protein